MADINAETCAQARPCCCRPPRRRLRQGQGRRRAGGPDSGHRRSGIGPHRGHRPQHRFRIQERRGGPPAAGPQGTRIDVRAISRVPVADSGANCARVTELIGAMRS
uniref:DUF1499 domain-containing protein n=1 Tax=Phenylobacterium glaciei TaxID=2803784 RepID=A0A974P7I6_9CAUL|nr:DUF1499 domain-containing protein [Phenylobacterium glaciei]